MSYTSVNIERSKDDCSKVKVTLIDPIGKHRIYARETILTQQQYDSVLLGNNEGVAILGNIPPQCVRLGIGIVDQQNGDVNEQALDCICGSGIISLPISDI